MTRYELLLFLHISFAIMWIGAGMLFHILGFRADRAHDEAAMRKIFDDLVALANVFFIPSSLLVLVFGIALVAESDFLAFDELWIVVGFVGFAITFLTGLLWIKPQSERVKKMIDRDGGMSPVAYRAAQRMIVFSRLDYVVLYLVVFDMVVKPTKDDTWTLVAMGVILVLATAFFYGRARALSLKAERPSTA
jgi:uncharacterized membrane protein